MRRQLFCKVTGILAVAALAFATSTVQAGITNGGFETPGTTSSSLAIPGVVQYLGGDNIAGWTVTGADVLVLDTNYTEPGILFNANSGFRSLDITGAGNTSPADGVSQSVATIAGQDYILSFYVGRGDDSGPNGRGNYLTPSTVALSIDGGALALFTNSNVTPNAINWQFFSVNFTATSASTLLAFTNGTPTFPANNFAGLDDVSLVAAVPEPATFAAAAAGLLPLIGVAIRRSRTRRSA